MCFLWFRVPTGRLSISPQEFARSLYGGRTPCRSPRTLRKFCKPRGCGRALRAHEIWLTAGASFLCSGILFALSLGDYLSRQSVWQAGCLSRASAVVCFETRPKQVLPDGMRATRKLVFQSGPHVLQANPRLRWTKSGVVNAMCRVLN